MKGNWYVIALNSTLSCNWIDPSGRVFNAFMHHESWIDRNKELLMDNYGIDIPDSVTIDCMEFLMEQGWIRMLQDYRDLIFSVDKISPHNLKIIEDFIFSNYQNEQIKRVLIGGKSKIVRFKWKEFIDEGVSFIDFVQNLNRLKEEW